MPSIIAVHSCGGLDFEHFHFDFGGSRHGRKTRGRVMVNQRNPRVGD